MGFCDDMLKPQNLCIYFAVLIVLIFLCVFYLKKIAGPERFDVGSSGTQNIAGLNSVTGAQFGLNTQSTAQALASGATMRFNAQQSQPGQGLRNTAYNADVTATAADLGIPSPGLVQQGKIDVTSVDAAAEESALNLANGVSNNANAVLANANGNRNTSNAAVERLANYRYAPQFDETWSEELARYQAATPPVEYAVIDDATRGYVRGDGFTVATDLRNYQGF
jgi:hypothetical protein